MVASDYDYIGMITRGSTSIDSICLAFSEKLKRQLKGPMCEPQLDMHSPCRKPVSKMRASPLLSNMGMTPQTIPYIPVHLWLALVGIQPYYNYKLLSHDHPC